MTLYELTLPHLNMKAENTARLIIAENLVHAPSLTPSDKICTVTEFFELAKTPPQRVYSTIIISGVFGHRGFDLSDAILKDAPAVLEDQGVLALDILSVEKLGISNVKALLNHPDKVSENTLLPRRALKSSLGRNFELLECKESFDTGVADHYIFRFHKGIVSPIEGAADLNPDTNTKRSVVGILKRLSGKAERDDVSEITPAAFRAALLGKHIQISPRVLLINPPLGLASIIKANLSPKAISVYEEPTSQKKNKPSEAMGIDYKGDWTGLSKVANASAEFIFVGDMGESVNSAEYFKLLENIARIRNRGGCVFLKQGNVQSSENASVHIGLSKTWPIDIMAWAKTRNSSVTISPVLMGPDSYSCVSDASPYDPLIRQDISDGEFDKALQKFKNYTNRNFFSAGKAARIVRLFDNMDHYCEALLIYASHFGVTVATRFNLIEAKYAECSLDDIVQSLDRLIPKYEKNEAVIFDLTGELHRLTCDYDMARRFWVKSLLQMQKTDGENETAEIIMRKIRLYLPCEIDCETSRFAIADPLLKSAIPKNTVILAESKVDRESINSLAERFDGRLVITPDLKGEMETTSKAEFKPLIGLIPENSDINKSSHEYAETISQDIIKALIKSFDGEIGSWLKKHRQSVALTVEDFLARHLLIIEAYAKAANTNPQADILLAGGELGYFDSSLNLLLSRLSHQKVWLHSDKPKSTLNAYSPLFESKSRGGIEPPSTSNIAGIEGWFKSVSDIYGESIDDYLSTQDINIDNSCLVLGNLANRYFGESTVTLADALQRAGEKPIIIDSSTIRTPSTDTSSLWEDCYLSKEVAETIPVLGMLRPKLEDPVLIEKLEGLRDHIETIVEALPLTYRGTPASFAFSRLAARVLSRYIPILLFNSLFAEKLMLRGTATHLATMSTREPHDHILADILQKKGLPTTFIQCTDILPHPRYKKPLANYVTAIDQAALEVFTDYLGVAKTAITLTGSPRSQINFHPRRVKSITELLDGRGLAVNPPLRVIFATRPGNLDVAIDALNVVAQQVVKQPGLQLIVKTHPREKPIRLAAYAKVLETHKIGGPANILNQGAAESLILVSDCVISFPSAVVRVATDLGKKTVVYAPDSDPNAEAHDMASPNMLTAFTVAQLTEHVDSLFLEPINSNDSQSERVALEEPLTQICKVITQHKRSRPNTKPKAVQRYRHIERYSSLSLKETSALIKQQASRAEMNYADIRLFRKALSLARDPKDYVSILRDVVHYAPPSNEAAQFFAKLSKVAAKHQSFNEAIGELKSQKLAAYAAQLEHNETLPHPYTSLALAQSCAAAGQLDLAFSWYDVGKTQNCKAALRIRFENEREALNLYRWKDGIEERDYTWPEKARLLVVAERGTAPEIYTSALPNNAEIEVYFDGKAGATLGAPKGIKSISSRDVLDDRAPEIEGIIQNANVLAKLITTQTLKLLKGSQHIAWLKDIRSAIEMELRAGLITQLRRHAALSKAVDGPYDAVVFVCHTPAFLALFSDNLKGTDLPIFTLGASQSPARRRAFGAMRKHGLSATRDKQEQLLKSLKKAPAAKAVGEFDDILNSKALRVPKNYDDKSVIAVTSWRITTIKDACLSLLKNFPPDAPITVFDTSRHLADAKRFLSDISDFSKDAPQDIRPFSAQNHNIPNPELKVLKDSALAKSIFASVKISKEGKNLPHAIQLGMWNQIGTLLYKTLPMLYDLHIQISAACQNSAETSLMVMPGRDAESLTAQNAATKFGVRTIDVQTAYFSKGHTYTAPNGDVVTAMDEWSKDLFVDWFKIPEEKIHVVGTSRFDRFSKLRLTHEVSSKEPKIRPHICIATQPIQSGLTKEMLSCLNDLYVSGVDFDCTVKLHPRQSETIITEIESIAQELYGAGRLVVTKHGDLAQILLVSDLVITAFSNVAIEAALMDRPVLIANFTEEDIPVPFMEFGIAEEARTHESFEALAKRMLYDEAFQEELKAKRHTYFERYPSQWKGEAGKDTAALILDNMRAPIIT